ncbi:MAG: DNA-processing protein DprA [Ruthenibacterium sp.]
MTQIQKEQVRPARIETWLWLANAVGYAAAQAKGILSMYENPEVLYGERCTTDLSMLLTPRQLQILQHTEPEDFIARKDDCAAQNVSILPYGAQDYPVLLCETDAPPIVLYYRGDIRILNHSLTFAMVGTRRPSAYGVEATRALAAPLAKAGVVLVSGLATGLDSESHKCAVAAGTPTIACIAFGHDICYPAANRTLKGVIEKQGLVISEYPPGTKVEKEYFLQRNRLIAGLSYGVCVAEARRASGTMNTVSTALRYNRDVFSVPGSIFSPLCEGTNHLLCEGAIPAVSAQDILAYYGIDAETTAEQETKEKSEILLSSEAKQVQAQLLCTPQSLTALCAKTNLPPHKIMAALTELELAGISSQQAGRQFVLVH